MEIIELKQVGNVAKTVFDFLDVSDTTRYEYKQRICLFLWFTKKQGINKNSFLEFKRYLKSRVDYSVSTKNKYLATTRIFLKELHRQGILPVDITHNIKAFSQFKKHKKEGVNEDEIRKLTNYLHELTDDRSNTRLKAIFSFLIYQGLRQVEITRLKVSDVDLVSKTAFIQGKGQDDKEIINLHPVTIKNIELYLKTNKISYGFLFPSRSNKNLNNQITTRGLRQIVTDVLRELEIERSVHGFRHYFTTKLIKNYKGDLLEVARYTRHRSLEMLQVYNDGIKLKQDLPRYYKAFEEVSF
ncbi:integrase [Candidatus Parcubacteria bacterium]|nr:MAG: integrase [Candidatus Parcubacteria bacterium]